MTKTSHVQLDCSRCYAGKDLCQVPHLQVQRCDGYSLIELVVSLALLTTVLMPLTAASVYFIKQKRIEQDITALTLARSHMEQTIYEERYADQLFEPESGKWRVQRLVERDGIEVGIHINVFYRGTSDPIVQLMTVRLSQ